MSFNRDWLENTPIDHTKNKEWPSYDRSIKVDVSDRLKNILSGFTSGETLIGFKTGVFLTQGTAAPSAPAGTGSALAGHVYFRTDGTGTYGDLYFRNTTGPECRLTLYDKLCLDNARLSNNTYLTANNTNGAAQNILKINTANAIEFASHIYVPNTNPASALVLAPKGYVDAVKHTIQDRTDKTSDYGAQQALVDGVVEAYGKTCHATGYTDSNANPTTARHALTGDSESSFTMFVKKGEYWKIVVASGTLTRVSWLPLGY